MMTQKLPLDLIWEKDSFNIEVSRELLGGNGIMVMFNRVPDLFDNLMTAIETYIQSQPGFPFIRTNASGQSVAAWDLSLRFFMLTSAYQMFMVAISHLVRGQITPAFGPVRRAIEGAGLAYLSKSNPELGDIFRSGDRDKLRNATTTGKILPKSDPQTSDLNEMIDFASGQIHNNFLSFAGRLKESLSVKDNKYHYIYEMAVHEVTEENYGLYLNVCLWVIRAASHVSRLLAVSFDLPPCDWHQQQASFHIDQEKLRLELKPIIFREDEQTASENNS
jgi:hypothetical protein